ncbi:MAG: glucosamine-6-phosphate deaminase [Bdellovibrionales bacterium]|nr:glucosamine-6-phosphate deaminase [Bdellovibrionales bacterium]
MEVIILKDPLEVSKLAAAHVVHQVQQKPMSCLGLATGSTPKNMYELLCQYYEQGKVDFSRVTSFNLDEYVGLASHHPASYGSYMEENLFRFINIRKENCHIPNGMAEDVPKECQSYEEKIQKAGGIDLQILGIGTDGHIAFNEPSSSLSSRTRLKTLTEQTRNDNRHFFAEEEEVPVHVITMGVGTIMEARKILLLATGEKKADAIAKTVEGPVTAMVPSSILQFHSKVALVIDEAAARLLTRKDYYRWVYMQKPPWQKQIADSFL